MPPLDTASGADDWVTAPAVTKDAATSPAGKDDWIPAPAEHWAAPAGGEFGDLNAQASAPPAPQGQVGADINAVGQGLVSGTGAVIAGAGRIAQAGAGPDAQRMLAALDLVDQGKNVLAYAKLNDAQRMQVASYIRGGPDDKQAQRDALQQAIEGADKPNAVTRAGMEVEEAAPSMFPVAPENEGIQTGVGRMIGGVGPLMGASALGGPAGLLASAAAIGAQAYDGTYQDAIAHGATHVDADSAAGKSAIGQIATTIAPIGKLIPLIPVPLREGFMKTLVNLGQQGVELGAGNTLGTIAQNYVAQQTYDPNRVVLKGTGDAAVDGVLASLIIRGGAATVGAARGASAATVDDVMKAPDIDSAIATAGKAAQAPTPDSGASEAVPGWGDLFTSKMPAPDAEEQSDNAEPIPQSAGAAASREMATPGSIPPETPAQKATALQKMVNQSAEDRLTPQGRDDAVYVPGVERPEAMRDFAPAAEGEMSTALEHKTFYNTDSNYHDQFDEQVKKNNGVMVDQLSNLFGDANAREAAMDEAKELMPGPVGLFDDQKPVDAQPIADRINEILASPAGKRDAVASQLNRILPKLYDADGNLETLPSQLKGIRDDITDKLYDKTPTSEGNAARTAKNQLRDVLGVVDTTIGAGLPGTKYQDYLTNLSAALGQVSKLDYLQKFLTGPRKLTDLAGNLQFRKVQNMLEDIQAHQADPTGGAKNCPGQR